MNKGVDDDGAEGEQIIWPAGLILARYVGAKYSRGAGGMEGMQVVELGAGAGVGAMTAAALGATAVATEHPTALAYLNSSATMNKAALETIQSKYLAHSGKANERKANSSSHANGTFHVRDLDWNIAAETCAEQAASGDSPLSTALPADVVLAADCTYNPEYADCFYDAIMAVTDTYSSNNKEGHKHKRRRPTVLICHDHDSVPSRIDHLQVRLSFCLHLTQAQAQELVKTN